MSDNLKIKCRKCWKVFMATVDEYPATRRCPECLTEHKINSEFDSVEL
jgi:Zn finger protein HypA/HybF involved in hydrogenase expression